MSTKKRFLFLGAGGMGMAPLAGWMSSAGYSVSGYDNQMQESVRRCLEKSGVSLPEFVLKEHLTEYDTIVHSSALRNNHPLLEAARSRGMEVLRRGEMLARLAKGKRFVAVAGSHGKTSTTGLVAHALRRLNSNVDYILGGFFAAGEFSAFHHTGSDWLVAELDESDGTIDLFDPEITLLLNVDWDHADRYSEKEELMATFRGLLTRTRSKVLLPDGFSSIKALSDGIDAAIESFPVQPGSSYKAMNRAAALTLLRFLPGAERTEEDCLDEFPGMARRLALLHESSLLRVYEDYAHHPTEIDSLLAGIRTTEAGRRLVVVFQPHRYSRTRQFKNEFAASLTGADACYLLPVYAAHESDVEGGGLEDLLAACGTEAPEVLSMDRSGAVQLSESLGSEPSTLIFIGAGDIHHFAAAFASWTHHDFDQQSAWLDYLEGRVAPDCSLKCDEPLAAKTTMRVGGSAAFYAEPTNFCDLRALLRAASLFGLKVFSLGRGSNVIVPEEGFDGLVIRFNSGAWRQVIPLGSDCLWAGAGVRLKEVCGQAAKAGLSGFEFLEGIPGSVGGSLRMNAGAMGSWIFDVVERVQMLNAEGDFLDVPKGAFHFGYRKVEEISQGIALGAILRSPEAEAVDAIRDRMDSYSTIRKSSQPREPSAGCIFKNPEGGHAGKLIDEAGLKGFAVGAAEVSSVHANFIVNKGGARAADVIELVRRVRSRVLAHAGVELEPEVLLLGASWDGLLTEGEVIHV
ncbi:MAG: UDP-N-acetylmuramate dehydrogenase [Coraliomargaritaceae bacterium]